MFFIILKAIFKSINLVLFGILIASVFCVWYYGINKTSNLVGEISSEVIDKTKDSFDNFKKGYGKKNDIKEQTTNFVNNIRIQNKEIFSWIGFILIGFLICFAALFLIFKLIGVLFFNK